jgi:hypothetical protein
VPPCGQPGLRAVTQLPCTQAAPEGQAPQLPPQPSSPQILPEQEGTHDAVAMQTPSLHDAFPAQTPQIPPQASAPQDLDAQAGMQAGADALPPQEASIAARRI